MHSIPRLKNLVISESCIMYRIKELDVHNKFDFSKIMKRSNDEGYEFQAWQRYKKMKETVEDSCHEQTKEEKQKEFEDFMEFENMKNNFEQKAQFLTPPINRNTSLTSSQSSITRTPNSEISHSSSPSESSTASCISRTSTCSTVTSGGHRQFKLPYLLLTPEEFDRRLKERLPEDVINEKLVSLFHPFSVFREKFILPLSEKYPGQAIELTDNTLGIDVAGFMAAYGTLFVEGCHISRLLRKKKEEKGKVVIPDKNERVMFRNLFRDLWEILGMIIMLIVYF